MRFYLIKEMPMVLSIDTNVGGLTFHRNAQAVHCGLNSHDVLDYEVKCCEKLVELLGDMFTDSGGSADNEGNENPEENMDTEEKVKRLKLSPSRELRVLSYIQPTGNKSLLFRVEGEILDRLKKIFDAQNKEIQVRISLKHFCGHLLSQVDNRMVQMGWVNDRNSSDLKNFSQFMTLSTNPLPIINSVDSHLGHCNGIVVIPDVLSKYWLLEGSRVSGIFSVEILTEKLREFDENLLHINKTILQNQLCPDTTIEAANGAEIRCHKSFLLAHQIPAFQAMFQNDFQEAQSNKVKMDDVSEEGVKALLAYLYHWDIDAPLKKCEIAFELLHVAQKYGIASLKAAMEKILLETKDESWCTIDVALQMFVLARGMEDGEMLKRGAIRVIKRNSAILKNSENLKTLLKGNHELIMEIMECLCQAN